MESITLNELIVSLQAIKKSRGLSGDERCIAVSNYGDRNGTMQAIPLNDIETVSIQETCYSDSGYCVPDQDEEPTQENLAVLLNYQYN